MDEFLEARSATFGARTLFPRSRLPPGHGLLRSRVQSVPRESPSPLVRVLAREKRPAINGYASSSSPFGEGCFASDSIRILAISCGVEPGLKSKRIQSLPGDGWAPSRRSSSVGGRPRPRGRPGPGAFVVFTGGA